MDFADFTTQLQALASKIQRQIDHTQTEEATKTAFVLPFIGLLGYDVFDPQEVVPEYTADVGIKRGEKVDYAILHDGKPAMLFECKGCHADLDGTNVNQLFRYFTATETRIGVLTNGVVYRFYSDLENRNQMDSRPFLEFNMLDVRQSLLGELRKMTKPHFDLDEILSAANDLKYTAEIKRFLNEQLSEPSDQLVRLLASQVYPGLRTQGVINQFATITRHAFQQFLSDHITQRLRSALGNEGASVMMTANVEEHIGPESEAESEAARDGGIETTSEELEGFYLIKSILRDTVKPQRFFYRDTVEYLNILLDNNIRKTVCRLYLNRRQKYIGLFNEEGKIERHPIEGIDDLFNYAEQVKIAVARLDD